MSPGPKARGRSPGVEFREAGQASRGQAEVEEVAEGCPGPPHWVACGPWTESPSPSQTWMPPTAPCTQVTCPWTPWRCTWTWTGTTPSTPTAMASGPPTPPRTTCWPSRPDLGKALPASQPPPCLRAAETRSPFPPGPPPPGGPLARLLTLWLLVGEEASAVGLPQGRCALACLNSVIFAGTQLGPPRCGGGWVSWEWHSF